MLNLEKELHKRVIGQDEAVHAVAQAVKTRQCGIEGSATVLSVLSCFLDLQAWERQNFPKLWQRLCLAVSRL